jgi:hypothetical protein
VQRRQRELTALVVGVHEQQQWLIDRSVRLGRL